MGYALRGNLFRPKNNLGFSVEEIVFFLYNFEVLCIFEEPLPMEKRISILGNTIPCQEASG